MLALTSLRRTSLLNSSRTSRSILVYILLCVCSIETKSAHKKKRRKHEKSLAEGIEAFCLMPSDEVVVSRVVDLKYSPILQTETWGWFLLEGH